MDSHGEDKTEQRYDTRSHSRRGRAAVEPSSMDEHGGATLTTGASRDGEIPHGIQGMERVQGAEGRGRESKADERAGPKADEKADENVE